MRPFHLPLKTRVRYEGLVRTVDRRPSTITAAEDFSSPIKRLVALTGFPYRRLSGKRQPAG